MSDFKRQVPILVNMINECVKMVLEDCRMLGMMPSWRLLLQNVNALVKAVNQERLAKKVLKDDEKEQFEKLDNKN
jgi:hypothetical protein